MSNMLKVIFPLVTIIASAAGIFFGLGLNGEKKTYMGQLVQTERALKQTPIFGYSANYLVNKGEPAASIEKAGKIAVGFMEERDNLQKELDTTKATLDSTESEVQSLTAKLTEVERKVETASQEMEAAKTKAQDLEGQLTKISEDLGGRDAAQVAAELDNSNEALRVAKAEKKILDDKVVTMSQELQKYKELEVLANEQRAPLSLTGKIVAINKEWNFVVLNVGKDDQLADGIDLTVYRGNDLVGKVRTVSVDANTAIADILPDWTKAEIQIGDQVIF
ncbi:MAG: hypothetical protein AAF984_03110 [Verrucomicrobiota bacterium]